MIVENLKKLSVNTNNTIKQIYYLYVLGKRDINCSVLAYKPLEQNFDDEPNITGAMRRNRTNTATTTTNLTSTPLAENRT